MLLLLSHFSRVRLCATPQTAAHQAPPSLGFSRQERWSGLPFPSPRQESEKWKWSRSVVSNSLRPHGLQPTRLLRPWDFPGKSTGVPSPSPTPTPTPVSKAAFPMILHNRWKIQRERLATHLLSGQRNQDICPHHHHPLENTVFSKATFPLTPVLAFHSNPLKWPGWELSSLHYRWGKS